MRLRARWLGLGVLCLASAAIAYAVLVRTVWGQQADAVATSGILDGSGDVVGPAMAALARPLLIVALAGCLVVLLLLALARLRFGAAAASVVVPATTIPAAYHLRDSMLSRPHLGVRGYDYNTFPSTHATTAIALLVAVLLVWPRPLDHRDLSRAGFVVSLVLIGNVTSYAHRPADVVGSLLLVCGSTLIAVALLGFRPPRPRPRRALRRSAPT
jgi:membrane-associated phospholipid phosphatase